MSSITCLTVYLLNSEAYHGIGAVTRLLCRTDEHVQNWEGYLRVTFWEGEHSKSKPHRYRIISSSGLIRANNSSMYRMMLRGDVLGSAVRVSHSVHASSTYTFGTLNATL